MNFNNLKLLRKQHGLTQEAVAEKLGVSRQAVAKWERGECLPDIESIISIADMYGVTVDFLVRDISLTDDAGGKKHMFGVTRVNDKGQITLPKKCREVFDINSGDTVLILGDEEKGIALVKVSEILDK